jgi:hypothetical protein
MVDRTERLLVFDYDTPDLQAMLAAIGSDRAPLRLDVAAVTVALRISGNLHSHILLVSFRATLTAIPQLTTRAQPRLWVTPHKSPDALTPGLASCRGWRAVSAFGPRAST